MSMKYLAAYALASLAHSSPSQADVEKICHAVHADVDKDTLAFVLESIDGRSVATLVAEGAAKMSAMAASAAPAAAAGGSGAAAAPAAAAAAAAPAADAGKAKKEEKVEEEDDDMGFGLFD